MTAKGIPVATSFSNAYNVNVRSLVGSTAPVGTAMNPAGSAPATTTSMPARMTAPGSSRPMPIRLRRYPRQIAIAAGQTIRPTRKSSGTASCSERVLLIDAGMAAATPPTKASAQATSMRYRRLQAAKRLVAGTVTAGSGRVAS